MISNISGNEKSNLNINKIENDNSPMKKIILANKGEADYIAAMDADNDGAVSMDEFDKYCEKNGISQEAKQKLLLTMQMAKTSEAILKEASKKDEEEIYTQEEENDKENKEIDEEDSKIDYEKYIKYCEEYTNSDTKEEPKIFIEKEAWLI